MIKAKSLKWNGNQAVSAGRSYTIHYDEDGSVSGRSSSYYVAIYNLMTSESSKKLGFDLIADAMEWADKEHYQPKLLGLLEGVQDIIGHAQKWFSKAKPNPTMSNLWVQTGVHFEEVSEMIESIYGKGTPKAEAMKVLANKYKNEMPDDNRLTADFEELPYIDDELEFLDALCDQIFTAIGVGYLAGYDMQGAFAEVIRSNWSKFEDGKPVILPNGKVGKGKNYEKPDLTKYLRKRG